MNFSRGFLYKIKMAHYLEMLEKRRMANLQDLLEKSKTIALIQEIAKNNIEPNFSKSVTYNYSAPVQTNVTQWSVFVRKYINSDCVSVIEHRFNTESEAMVFSKNNWNLGDYF